MSLTVDSVTMREVPDDGRPERVGHRYVLSVDVSNTGTAPVWVATRSSSLDYDPARHALAVGWGSTDSERAECPQRPQPFTEVAPGGRTVLEDVIVSPVEYVEVATDDLATVSIGTADIELDVRRVDCEVAYADEEPPGRIDMTGSSPRRIVELHRARGGMDR